MRAPAEPVELVTEARKALEQVKESLLTPTPRSVSACGEPLAAAAERLRRLRVLHQAVGVTGAEEAGGGGTTGGLQTLAAGLHRDLAEVNGLLQQAGAFYLGWSRILKTAAGTYGADGGIDGPAVNGLSIKG